VAAATTLYIPLPVAALQQLWQPYSSVSTVIVVIIITTSTITSIIA
jgi:hypothetical protein